MTQRYELEHARPHSENGYCGKCRRRLEHGDRVTNAFIVESIGPDPRNLARRGVNMYEEFELVHIDCADPKLVKGA